MSKKSFYFLVFIAVLILVSSLLIQRKNQQAQSSVVSAEGKLVEGNPDFPVLSEAVIANSHRKLELGKQGYEAVYEINLTPYEAMSWYHDELIKQGWTIYDESIEDVVTDLYIRAERGNEKINVFGETEDGKTEVTIEYPVQ